MLKPTNAIPLSICKFFAVLFFIKNALPTHVIKLALMPSFANSRLDSVEVMIVLAEGMSFVTLDFGVLCDKAGFLLDLLGMLSPFG